MIVDGTFFGDEINISGRISEEYEGYYGFTLKPGFMAGYAKIPEYGEYPCASSGWIVEGCLCLYVKTCWGWAYIWVPVELITGIDEILEGFINQNDVIEEEDLLNDEEYTDAEGEVDWPEESTYW